MDDPPADRGVVTFTASAWRDRASILALTAGAVSVAILVVEGPPGSGYGWGSVVISAGVVAGLFMAMAYMVRSDRPSRALASAAAALLVVVMFGASLVGNSGGLAGRLAGARHVLDFGRSGR
jgi:hypothetical protein